MNKDVLIGMNDIPMAPEKVIGRVSAIIRYPVSSVGGERLSRAELGPTGVLRDRQYGIYDAETGAVAFPGRNPEWNSTPRLYARLSGDHVELSDDGCNWYHEGDTSLPAVISRAVGRPAELRVASDQFPLRYDRAPIHLLSLQSLATLRRLLPSSQIDERRFRPNIVVDLPDAPGDIPEYALIGREFQLGWFSGHPAEVKRRHWFSGPGSQDPP